MLQNFCYKPVTKINFLGKEKKANFRCKQSQNNQKTNCMTPPNLALLIVNHAILELGGYYDAAVSEYLTGKRSVDLVATINMILVAFTIMIEYSENDNRRTLYKNYETKYLTIKSLLIR